MAQFILIRHKVRDFTVWKTGFDSHDAKRTEAGMTVKHVLRGADDPNEVIVLVEAKDLERAKAFVASPELRQGMQSSGVIDKPDVYFLKE
jgi:heme-degrading monooxygenase HmoA